MRYSVDRKNQWQDSSEPFSQHDLTHENKQTLKEIHCLRYLVRNHISKPSHTMCLQNKVTIQMLLYFWYCVAQTMQTFMTETIMQKHNEVNIFKENIILLCRLPLYLLSGYVMCFCKEALNESNAHVFGLCTRKQLYPLKYLVYNLFTLTYRNRNNNSVLASVVNYV